MILWRTDMSVLTRMYFPKLVFWISHRLESVRGLFFFMKYLYFHVASLGSFRINRSNISDLNLLVPFCLLLGPLWQYCKTHKYVLLLQRKHQKVWRLRWFVHCLWIQYSFGSSRFFLNQWVTKIEHKLFLIIWNVSSHTEGQCPLAQSCNSFSCANDTSAHSQFHFPKLRLYILYWNWSCSFLQPRLHSWMRFRLLRPGSGIANWRRSLAMIFPSHPSLRRVAKFKVPGEK